ncbi:MAG TPA: RnfABCDGE type electron transport complex subunit D [Thermodesulforhabdus norvegica]|uniref:Ion-translocating oxidoreductase complex subunit D n=1 Tax=Thermodesulforhabdus norvegica TaxID=39841 RepID=A0A7C0WUW7_9BACT|nr:RnfABCDGE type electron transport complex subunit D [Thermodesulforhabdus norvegica]
MTEKLYVSSSPHVLSSEDVPKIMRHVIYALIPTIGGAVYFFGLRALAVIVLCGAVAVITEAVILAVRKKKVSTIMDTSALLTGILFALTLPPSVSFGTAAIGAFIAVAVGKQVFGGFGQNIFNPALVGRAFLQAAFPVEMTTWVPPRVLQKVDAVSFATPLGGFKFSHLMTSHTSLFLGSVGGSLGETSALLIIIGGIYLLWRRYIDWRIPVSACASLVLLSAIFYLINPQKYPDPVFMLFAGGFMLGVWFMATDPVTSPVHPKAVWIYGAGIGFLVVIIRLFGGMPEGIMYSILFMNALSPMLERFTRPRMLGEER